MKALKIKKKNDQDSEFIMITHLVPLILSRIWNPSYGGGSFVPSLRRWFPVTPPLTLLLGIVYTVAGRSSPRSLVEFSVCSISDVVASSCIAVVVIVIVVG